MKKQQFIKVAIIDTDRKIVLPAKIRNSLASFYKELKCDTIDIVTRFIGGQELDVICDDNGLLDESKRGKPAIITTDERGNLVEQIVGNVILARHDEDGNMSSLLDKDYAAIAMSLIQFHNGQMGVSAVI